MYASMNDIIYIYTRFFVFPGDLNASVLIDDKLLIFMHIIFVTKHIEG